MKQTFKTYAPVVLTLVLLSLPLVSLAAANINPTDTFQGANQNPTAPSGSYSVENPLKVSNFCDLLRVVLNALIIIGLPVAVVFLVLVGFQFIVARGSDTRLKDAKRNLLNTVIGIALFLGAWTIAEIIKSTLQALGVTGFGSC